MSRKQQIVGLGQVTLTNSYAAISATSAYYKSFTVQSSVANTGVVTIADSNGNPIEELLPGESMTFLGDNMDNGTASQMDISTVQAKSTVAGDLLSVSVASGV